METIGYNAVEDRNDPEYVRKNAPFLCNHKSAWLGSGYYFWEKDEDRGHEWGKIGYKNKYILGKSTLVLPNCLDLLGDVDDMKYFKYLLKILKEQHQKFNIKDPNDIPMGKAIEYLKQISLKGKYADIFDFDSIRSVDYPPSSQPIKYVKTREEVLYLNPRVQICVINKKECVKSYEIIYPKHYL